MIMRNNAETQHMPDLVAYLDGELSERDHRQVATALRSSPALQQEADRLEHVSSLVANLDRATPSVDFSATFLQRLEQVQREEQIEQETLLARWQRQWAEWQDWFIAGEGWKEWLAGGHWTPAFVPVASLLIILGALFSGTLLTSNPREQNQLAQSDQIPAQVVENPAFFRDYWRTVRLERWAHFDEIAKVQAPARPNIDLPRENTPSRVVEDPNFFIHYQILRRMEQFQHFESVQNVHNINEEQI
jgi:anti-sigma factor RsiW